MEGKRGGYRLNRLHGQLAVNIVVIKESSMGDLLGNEEKMAAC